MKYPDVTLERALTNPIISIIKRVDGKILGSGIYYVAEEKNKAFLLKKNKYYKEEKYISSFNIQYSFVLSFHSDFSNRQFSTFPFSSILKSC